MQPAFAIISGNAELLTDLDATVTSSRELILNKLRAARQSGALSLPEVQPRPEHYLPVAQVGDTSPDGLLARFTAELTRLSGEVFVAEGDDAAREKVVELLQAHQAKHILAWHFTHIPVKKLRAAIEEVGIKIAQPATHDEFRSEILSLCEGAKVGLTGADAAIAATGTLVVSAAPGKGRIPTILPPVHLVVITLERLVPRLEDWVAIQRANGLEAVRAASNFCFISGPSRTGDIEMELVLGVHGPGKVQVVVKK